MAFSMVSLNSLLAYCHRLLMFWCVQHVSPCIYWSKFIVKVLCIVALFASVQLKEIFYSERSLCMKSVLIKPTSYENFRFLLAMKPNIYMDKECV